jgi:hypothetical protein
MVRPTDGGRLDLRAGRSTCHVPITGTDCHLDGYGRSVSHEATHVERGSGGLGGVGPGHQFIDVELNC